MPSSRNGRYVAIGLMLFALFFGAGNLIFPAAMGQSAGVNIGWALLGFCITGVGLPLLGVIAVAFSGTRDAQSLASRVHPVYGVIYTVMSYLAIGPCFAVPRTGTVSFEIAVRPFLSAETTGVALPIFLAVFFGIVYWFASSPSKLVDRIGKVLTPALVLTLIIFIVQSFITPMGDPQKPTVAYATPAVAAVQGVLDGYNTLDGLVSLIFGTLVVATVREAGFKNAREISRQVYKSGLLAGCMLGLIYIFVAKIGAESVTVIGMQDTGAPILALSAQHFFGHAGTLLLAVMVLLACLTTSIGLITCCAAYFLKLTGKFTYFGWVTIFTIVSYLIGLFGLKTIITSTIPILMFLYPLCMTLIVLAFLNNLFDGRQCVYVSTIAAVFVMAVVNGLETAGVDLGGLETLLRDSVPLHTVGLGWISFAVAGAFLGLVWKAVRPVKGEDE